MSRTVKSLKKVGQFKGDSGDYLQAFTAGTVAPEQPKMSKTKEAPVIDEAARKLELQKEEAKRRTRGAKSTVLTGSSKLG